ncbi:hypothetical protein FRC17_002442 [Serendipita sp. 399]|nr:hypothetical protein FRC17_002442 [Serendipita sp. 399]
MFFKNIFLVALTIAPIAVLAAPATPNLHRRDAGASGGNTVATAIASVGASVVVNTQSHATEASSTEIFTFGPGKQLIKELIIDISGVKKALKMLEEGKPIKKVLKAFHHYHKKHGHHHHRHHHHHLLHHLFHKGKGETGNEEKGHEPEHNEKPTDTNENKSVADAATSATSAASTDSSPTTKDAPAPSPAPASGSPDAAKKDAGGATTSSSSSAPASAATPAATPAPQ